MTQDENCSLLTAFSSSWCPAGRRSRQTGLSSLVSPALAAVKANQGVFWLFSVARWFLSCDELLVHPDSSEPALCETPTT